MSRRPTPKQPPAEPWELGDAASEYDEMVGAPAEERGFRRPAVTSGECPANLLAFFSMRGISEDTVSAFGVFGMLRDGQAAVVWPWSHLGEVVHATYRVGGKMEAEPRTQPCLLNWPADGEIADAPVVFCPDELDCMAFAEAGFAYAVYGEAERIGPSISPYADALAAATRIYLAPGLLDACAEEITRRVGRHRVWTILPWPEGKTACDMLVSGGRDALVTAVAEAEPCPIDGLQVVRVGTLSALRNRPPPAVMTTGCGATDDVLSFPTEGKLIVITGVPAMGKSTWLTYIAMHTTRHHARRWAIYGPEMSPWEEYAAHCAQILMGKPLRRHQRGFEADGKPEMSDAEVMAAERWLRDRIFLLEHDSQDSAPTLDWILTMGEAAVLRHGITDLAIDPWTEVARGTSGGGRGDPSAVDMLQRDLQRLTAFGRRHSVNVWVVAHPTKLLPPKPGAALPVPTAYDIAGGAQWYNKATLVLAVHLRDDVTEIHNQKVRFRRLGKSNATAKLMLDRSNGRFRSADNQLPLGGYADA